MKTWEKVLLLLTIITICCMITSYFLFEGYTQDERNSDSKKVKDAGMVIQNLITSGVLPSKIPLNNKSRQILIGAASAIIRIIKNDAISYFNQPSDNLEQGIEKMVANSLDTYTTDIDITSESRELSVSSPIVTTDTSVSSPIVTTDTSVSSLIVN